MEKREKPKRVVYPDNAPPPRDMDGSAEFDEGLEPDPEDFEMLRAMEKNPALKASVCKLFGPAEMQ